MNGLAASHCCSGDMKFSGASVWARATLRMDCRQSGSYPRPAWRRSLGRV